MRFFPVCRTRVLCWRDFLPQNTTTMSDRRKLATEMERCFKKIGEGMEVFDEQWTVLMEADTPKLKERMEEEINSTIKKMQRLRDQVRGWIAQADIKDKEPLHRSRRDVESRMEKLQEYQREAKTKLFSRAGLELNKIDPVMKNRIDATHFLTESIATLNCQIEQFESEVESFEGGVNRKKLDKEKLDKLELIELCLAAHRGHLVKFEAMLRMMDNETLSPDTVFGLKDEFEFYVDSVADGTIPETDHMYFGIEFDAEQRLEELQSKSPEDSCSVSVADSVEQSSKSEAENGLAPVTTPVVPPPCVLITPAKGSPVPVKSQKAVSKRANGMTNGHHRRQDPKAHPTVNPLLNGARRLKSPTQPFRSFAAAAAAKNARKAEAKKAVKIGESNVVASKSFAGTLAPGPAVRPSAVPAEAQPRKLFAELLAASKASLGTAAPAKSTGFQAPSHVPTVPLAVSTTSSIVTPSIPTTTIRPRTKLPNGEASGPEEIRRYAVAAKPSPTGLPAPAPAKPVIKPAAVAPKPENPAPPVAASVVNGEKRELVRRSAERSVEKPVAPSVASVVPREPARVVAEKTPSEQPVSVLQVAKSTNTDPVNSVPATEERSGPGWLTRRDEIIRASLAGVNGLDGYRTDKMAAIWSPDVVSSDWSTSTARADITNKSVDTSSAHVPLSSFSNRLPFVNLPSANEFFVSERPRRRHPLTELFENDSFVDLLSDEVIFFLFYFLGRADPYVRIHAARLLEKRDWGFYTKVSSWLRRVRIPRIKTEEYERGDYEYWDTEKWRCEKTTDTLIDYKLIWRTPSPSHRS